MKKTLTVAAAIGGFTVALWVPGLTPALADTSDCPQGATPAQGSPCWAPHNPPPECKGVSAALHARTIQEQRDVIKIQRKALRALRAKLARG